MQLINQNIEKVNSSEFNLPFKAFKDFKSLKLMSAAPEFKSVVKNI